MRKLTSLLFLLAAALVQARTVALWPLEYDGNAFDGRCVINPSNDLMCVNGTNVASGVGWNLPPNPDMTALRACEPFNEKAVRYESGHTNRGFLYNEYTGMFVDRRRDFTVEGWIKLLDLPARDQWSMIVGGFDLGGNSSMRWTLSLRRRSSENYACTWILWANGGSGDQVFSACASEEASYALTNTWLHVALTHRAYVNQYDTWELYLDGVKTGDTITQHGNLPAGEERQCFDIGARRSAGNPLPAVFDYWRISDEVLEPSRFLCAGGAGTVVQARTVAYWPLETTPDGAVDGRDAVGNANLSSGFHDTTAQYNTMVPSTDCAFTDNPPNATVTLPNGNAGSLQGCKTGSMLRRDDLGAALNLSASFTVEGWFAPRVCDRTAKVSAKDVVSYLFGTRHDYGAGWVLAYRPMSRTNAQFDIYCIDQTGNIRNNVKLSGAFNVSGWYEKWHHLALVYDKDGGDNGYGLWSLYIDGALAGSAGNPRAAVPITSDRFFFVGGRAQIADQSFQGRIDCVRISQAALAPNQLLCAETGAQAATDVLALWPLNVAADGVLDLCDVSGNGRHFATFDSMVSRQHVLPDADIDGPVITNPESSRSFRGCRTGTHGSVRFRDPDAATDNHRSYLETGDALVMNAMKGGRDFTFECYYRRRAAAKDVSGDQEVFFAAVNNSGDGKQRFVAIRFFRKSNGFYIWEDLNTSQGALPDTLFPGTADADLPVDVWHHIALSHAIETVDGVPKTVWRLYVNGTLKGSASADYGGGSRTCQYALFGGRFFADRNSVIGNLSSMRLSCGALDPSDFLCATPAAAVAETTEKTVVYWPVDAGADGLAGKVDTSLPLAAAGATTPSSESARLSIPNKTALTNSVTGNARLNAGSYALGAGGTLTAAAAGFALSFTHPFTVEGWVKWTAGATPGLSDVVCAGETDAGTGVRLYVDTTGATPRLGVFAREPWPATPMADALFDADLSPMQGVWTHVAVTYDPWLGNGTWTLFLDGRPAGSPVRNFWRPGAASYFRSGDFRLGERVAEKGVALSFDMWRIISDVVAPEEFLYASPQGVSIFIR